MVYKFFNKNLVEVVLPIFFQRNLLPNQIINLKMNFTSRSLETLIEEKFIHPSEAIFRELI